MESHFLYLAPRSSFTVAKSYSATGLESKIPCFWCVFFWLAFVNYRAEILQERAEGCIQVKKIRQDLFCGFVGVVFSKVVLRYFSNISSSPSP